jgi:hypothetical protein
MSKNHYFYGENSLKSTTIFNIIFQRHRSQARQPPEATHLSLVYLIPTILSAALKFHFWGQWLSWNSGQLCQTLVLYMRLV